MISLSRSKFATSAHSYPVLNKFTDATEDTVSVTKYTFAPGIVEKII